MMTRTSTLLAIAVAVAKGCSHAPPSLLETVDGPDAFEPGAEGRYGTGDAADA